MKFTRRSMLRTGGAATIAFTALACGGAASGRSGNKGLRLVRDPDRLLDLPEGFSYRLFPVAGGEMSDGFLRPGHFDGMACFAHPDDPAKWVLVRNHEKFLSISEGGPFGEDHERLSRLDPAKLYDRTASGKPCIGGTTNVIVDAATGAFERDHLSLVGTIGNCAGGAMPWGSWLSCEEQMSSAGKDTGKDHGYIFEVSAAATGPVDPVPLKAMGRFGHEAASHDPDEGIVYMTEDNDEGLFYRFIPDVRGQLAQGGRLQALAMEGWEGADTRNFPADFRRRTARRVVPGRAFKARWIDLDDVEARQMMLRVRGARQGAAIFCRGEGMAYGRDEQGVGHHYFNCTEGGRERVGQVWRYTPASSEIQLVYESSSARKLDLCDNLAMTGWGDLLICEDGRGDNYLRLLTPEGDIRDFARNAHRGRYEFCGACFSPDQRFLFVNVQQPGYTFAITGPWESLRTGA
ncbi:PhoX family protein [Sphingomicrobium flavum]|uniref:PhoX family protein n=1 Tax=Sphingomicrobium flavum TaxID=1229164 RepID=UPI0021AE0FC1|nr:PhoX family protein [Sphingomicrobium flavum]